MTGLALLACASWPAGAAPTDSSAISAAIVTLREQDAAVLRVGERLVTAGRAFCRETGRSYGMTVQLSSQYGADYRLAARAILGVSNRPTVTVVARDGAAASAGLLPKDIIVAVDRHAFDEREPSAKRGSFAATDRALDTIDAAFDDGTALVSVLRDDRPLTFRVVARPACRARFDVRSGRGDNAWSDGSYVQISSDLMAETSGDDELAVILAHELAHNILRHPQRRKAHEPGLSTPATETEADRLSVYLLDAAGVPTTSAVAFWSRWGRAHDFGIFSDRSHPRWKQRVAAINGEIANIAAQRAAGRPVAAPADLQAR